MPAMPRDDHVPAFDYAAIALLADALGVHPEVYAELLELRPGTPLDRAEFGQQVGQLVAQRALDA